MSVNDELLQRAVKHQLYLTRLQSYEAARVRSMLSAAIPDLLERVQARIETITARGFDAGPVTTKRLRDLAVGIAEMVNPTLSGVGKEFMRNLEPIARQEAQWAAGSVKKEMPIEVEMVLPSPAQLQALASTEPIVGLPLTEWFDGLSEATGRSVTQAVRMGVIQGQTTQQIVQRLRQDVFGLLPGQRARGMTRQAEAIARTATNHVSTQARMLTYQANQGLIGALLWVATLDSRTTPLCQSLDQTKFYFDHGPRPPGPPAHVGCRSSLSPITKSWQELGIPGLKEMPEGTRASLNGQVPAGTTYGQWLRGRVQAGDMDTVKEALGPTRAKLFAAGGMEVSSFVDRRGRLLTLAELRTREADVFDRLNVRVPSHN